MCGILGYFSNLKIKDSQLFKLKKAASYLKERGPDYLGTINGKNYFLSNSRLKIVSKKNYILPLYKHGKYISFSGEILNHRDLKNFLISKKYKFFTDTDTEVILSLYDYYGNKFVEYLEGFFSICIYDIKKNLVILTVDRVGNKAIFYNFSKGKILFSSQQSYMVRSGFLGFEINKKKIDESLVFGDVSGEETLHKNINKLLPGEILVYNFNKIKKSNYYSLIDFVKNIDDQKKQDLNNSITNIHNVLKLNIDLWSNNCAYEKSVLLSGGVDSGIISMILSNKSKKLKSFTAKFLGDKDFRSLNEINEIDDLINQYNIKKNIINCSKSNLLKNINKLYNNFEEPLPSSSLLLQNLSKSINKNTGTRICFTGDGADEIFGGYSRHHIVNNQYKKDNNLDTIALGLNYLSVERLKKFFNKNFQIPDTRADFLRNLQSTSAINKILLYDIKYYLPMFLKSNEVVGMNSSIEFRSPFTDYKLIQESFMLKDEFKVFKSAGKFILKKIFANYLKKKFMKKRLFSVPYIAKEFRSGQFREFLLNLNNNSKISDYYSVQGIKKLLQDHTRTDHSNTLMRLLTLELFLQSKTK